MRQKSAALKARNNSFGIVVVKRGLGPTIDKRIFRLKKMFAPDAEPPIPPTAGVDEAPGPGFD